MDAIGRQLLIFPVRIDCQGWKLGVFGFGPPKLKECQLGRMLL